MKLHILLAVSFAWAARHTAPPTYRRRDPATSEVLQCEQCPPGTVVRRHCGPRRPTVCEPCPAGTFAEQWHWGETCRHCTAICKEKQLVRHECNSTHDRLCECAPGYYMEVEFCVRHAVCPPGMGAAVLGSPERNTVCERCPRGHFSSVASATEHCAPHKNCSALGRRTLRAGTPAHDTVCEDEAQCSQLRDRCLSDVTLCEDTMFQFLASQQLCWHQVDCLWDWLPGRKVDRRSAEWTKEACSPLQGALRLLSLWRDQNRGQEKLFGIIRGLNHCEKLLSRCARPDNLTLDDLRAVVDSLPGDPVGDKDIRLVLRSCRPREHLLRILRAWRVQNPEQDVAKGLALGLSKLRHRSVPRQLYRSIRKIGKVLGTFSAQKANEKTFSDLIRGATCLTSKSYNN
ncbi:tumor necrosis factor receptor superfamily member 11B-like [Scleropages formosus]|uniref:Tumor necrosis factor receptor superfamily member 11B-like n=1 Tax=Scleropages formosus TaxID=113540 RepID=A0A8C9UXR2_SCLFO|nr:tumor necrosis factor receptor superfamily member 11B-like [Scleropages formosus]